MISHSYRSLWCLALLSCSAATAGAADMAIKLRTSDGSTNLAIQNVAGSTVATIDSLGNGSFTAVSGDAGGLTNVPASQLTGLISNTSLNNSSVTLQGNTFNTASHLVKLDGSGNMSLPNGASITIGSLHGTIVPSGTIILTTSTCPSGFSEFTGARGFYLAGVPSGGTAGGTVGSAMTDLANPNHNHTITTTTTSITGGLPVTTVVTSVTSPTGNVDRGTVAPYFQIRLCQVP